MYFDANLPFPCSIFREANLVGTNLGGVWLRHFSTSFNGRPIPAIGARTAAGEGASGDGARGFRRIVGRAPKIRGIPGIRVEPPVIDTNMVFFRLERDGLSVADFLAALSQRGVRMGTLRDGVVRAVLHYLVSDDDVDATAVTIRSVLQAEPQ